MVCWPLPAENKTVVHHVHASWDDAQDRFLGPEKLMERVKGLLPDFSLFDMPWEWKKWVDALEASGRLVPIRRWRVPNAALTWLWAHPDDREDDMRALEAEAEAGVNAVTAWGRARRAWTRDPACARSLHSLDRSDAEWAILIEDPGQVTWIPDTYAPLMVPRTRDVRSRPKVTARNRHALDSAAVTCGIGRSRSRQYGYHLSLISYL